jgi:outer membrane protein
MFFFILIFSIYGNCFASEVHGIKELYSSARDIDYRLKSAEHQYKSMKEKDNQALSYLLPQISASGKISYYDTDIYGEYNTKNYGIGLSVPLLNMTYYYNLKQSKEIVKAYEYVNEDAKQDLIVRLTESYINSIFSYQNIKITESAINTIVSQIKQAEKYFESGIISITNVHEIEAEFAKKKYELISNQNSYKDNLLQLNTITGIDSQNLKCMDTDNFVKLDIKDIDYWIDAAKANNANLKYYDKLVSKAAFDEKAAKSNFLPTVDLSAGYSVTNTTNYLQYPETKYKSITLSLNIPIYSGGHTKSVVREMKEKKYKAVSDYQQVFMDVKLKISKSLTNMENLISEIDSLNALVKSYQTTLDSYQKGLKAGVSTIVDIADATNNLYQSKISLNKAKYEYYMNYIYLRYYSGTISESDIDFLNGIFYKNCDEVKF